MTAGQMSAVYAIVGVADHGWGSVHTLGFGALSVVLLAGFVARQAGAATPLLPLRVFRLHLLCGANLVQALMAAGLFRFLFLGTPYVRRVLGDDAMATGLAFLPIALTTGAVMSALTALAMSVASPDDARLASGLFNTNPSRSAGLWAWPSSPPWRPRAQKACSPTGKAQRPR